MDRERPPLPSHVGDTPALPAAYGRTLDAGLSALGMRLPASARSAIDGHVRLLLAWTAAINLTAIRDPAAVATVHVLDSLSAAPWLGRRDVDSLLDLGSGGGFPGIPLAAALPEVAVTLAEPIGKKARFLETAVAASGLAGRVTVAPVRAESLVTRQPHDHGWAVVTARAVAPTADLIELAFPLLRPGGALVAWKRGDLTAELAAAWRAVEALGGGRIDVVDVGLDDLPGHRLVVVERTGTVPSGYPRDPAVRKRRPW